MTPTTAAPARPAAGKAGTYVVLVTATAALGGLLFGYDTGIIASALPQIASLFDLGSVGQQIVASSILVGCIIGAMLAGPASDRVGRRKVLAAVGALFILAALGCAFSHTVELLTVCRVLLGIAVGGASQIVPVYIAELAPAARRGSLVVVFQTAVIVGILISSISGYFLDEEAGGWRLTVALGAVPALLLLVGMLFLPESPRWLVLRGRGDEARRVLARVRDTQAEVDAEMVEIETVGEGPAQGGWSEVRSRRVRPALIAGLGVALFCQITGINAVIYYAPTILNSAGFDPQRSLLVSISVNVVLLLFTIIGLFLVDRWGRRRLLLAWVPLSIVALVVLAFSFNGTQASGPAWLTMVGLMGFQAFNGGSLSVAVWLIASEVFPLRVRGKAMALACLTVWVADLAVSLTTLSLVEGLGPRGAFLLYAGISVAALAFVYFCVPETKGKTLEQIEESLDDRTFAPLARKR